MNAEKILGGLIGGFLGSAASGKSKGRRLRAGGGAVLNQIKRGLSSPQGILTAVGLAFGAFEAYRQSRSDNNPPEDGGTSNFPPPPTSVHAATAPPRPSSVIGDMSPPTTPPAVPPPIPSSISGATEKVDGPDAGGVSETTGGATALRLIRAMIAAAHADGVLDDDERGAILGRLEESGLDDDERRFIIDELNTPKSIAELTEGVTDPSLKRMIFGLSVAAIVEDSESETEYLAELAAALDLNDDEVSDLKRRFERKEGR